MRRQTILSVLAGAAFMGIMLFGAALQIDPSIRADHDEFDLGLELPHPTPANWSVRTEFPDAKTQRGPYMRCRAALIVDNRAGEILYDRRAYERRPIASLTKLLTALVFLDQHPDLSAVAAVTKQDALNSSRSRLRRGVKLTLREFLSAALMSSDNRAARVLSRSAGITVDSFVVLMNVKAAELGMDSTFVVEPTGLSELNVSNARDCAILTNAALDNHLIRHISQQREMNVISKNKRRRWIQLVNTNRLLATSIDFTGSKTGYIVESGWCMTARATTPDGDDITTVVLGAPTEGSRFRAVRDGLRWAFKLPPANAQATAREEG